MINTEIDRWLIAVEKLSKSIDALHAAKEKFKLKLAKSAKKIGTKDKSEDKDKSDKDKSVKDKSVKDKSAKDKAITKGKVIAKVKTT